ALSRGQGGAGLRGRGGGAVSRERGGGVRQRPRAGRDGRAGLVPLMIGIEALAVDPGTLSLPIADLCRARGLDPANFCGRLYCRDRSVVGPWEAVVPRAVNAAKEVVTAEAREAVRLLIVATESGVDQEKPISSWVHRLLDLRPDCRNFEIKHACYGGTAA